MYRNTNRIVFVMRDGEVTLQCSGTAENYCHHWVLTVNLNHDIPKEAQVSGTQILFQFDCVIQPIVLYGIDGVHSVHSYTRWDKYPSEALHAEFRQMILKIQKKTPTNACKEELARFPLAINIHIIDAFTKKSHRHPGF